MFAVTPCPSHVRGPIDEYAKQLKCITEARNYAAVGVQTAFVKEVDR